MANLRVGEQYDNAFLGILQNEGKIVDFLDVLFRFFLRRTDLFVEMKEPGGKMGFPPGVARKLVLNAFDKNAEFYKQMLAQQKQQHTQQKPVQEQLPQSAEVPMTERAVVPAESSVVDPNLTTADPPASDTSGQCVASAQKDSVVEDPEPMESDNMTNGTATPAGTAQGEHVDVSTRGGEKLCDTVADGKPLAVADKKSTTAPPDELDENPVLTEQQKIFQSNPDSYNGAIRDNYSWSQNINDLDIKIKVPADVKKGKQVKVEITRHHLTASYSTPAGEWCPVVDGDLPWDINKEQSMWSIEPGVGILVNLEKVQERWWEALLKDEPAISVRKIDASRPITDLDGEAQAKVEEMMFNEHCKRTGQPQSHERQVHSMLKNAWDVEGSPFKGQDFDPSKFSVSAPGSFN